MLNALAIIALLALGGASFLFSMVCLRVAIDLLLEGPSAADRAYESGAGLLTPAFPSLP